MPTKVKEVVVAEEATKEEEVVVAEEVTVKVIAEFYDLQAKETLRKISDVFNVTKERADYLIKRNLVELI